MASCSKKTILHLSFSVKSSAIYLSIDRSIDLSINQQHDGRTGRHFCRSRIFPYRDLINNCQITCFKSPKIQKLAFYRKSSNWGFMSCRKIHSHLGFACFWESVKDRHKWRHRCGLIRHRLNQSYINGCRRWSTSLWISVKGRWTKNYLPSWTHSNALIIKFYSIIL